MALEAFKDRLVLVTGAGDGIGEMLARGFALAGMRVGVLDIRRDAAERVAAEIGASAFALQADVSDRDSLAVAVADLRTREAALAILWINAGVGVGSGLLNAKPNAVDWGFGVNALGMIWTAQAFAPLMTGAGEKHVGFTASTAALRAPQAPNGLYATTKHACLGVAEGLAAEFAGQGIASTIVFPGLLNTGIWDGARARPDRFGGVRRQDPAIADMWRNAKSPALMWPHIAAKIDAGGGYLVCTTDAGETRKAFSSRAQSILDGFVEI